MTTAVSVKEIFFTLQGEGGRAGRAVVFCRFGGRNLWSGSEEDRASAVCRFCDTDFAGSDGPCGGKGTKARVLAGAIRATRAGQTGGKTIEVFTDGEPLLQVDRASIDAIRSNDFAIALETNGTQPVPDGLDWVCVNLKADTPAVLLRGPELKPFFPQNQAMPDRFEHLEFRHFCLQPMDGPEQKTNLQLVVDYCLKPPSGASACRHTRSLASHD